MVPLSFVLRSLSILLLIMMSFCYWSHPDSFAAVTFWPAWAWLLIGLFLAIMGGRHVKKWVFTTIILMWLGYMFVFVEETRSLIRYQFFSRPGATTIKQQEKALRIVSLNCAGGNLEAAAEVKLYEPDIVLLQESPTRKEVEVLGSELFGNDGGIAWGSNTSIIARGPIQLIPLGLLEGMLMTQARVHLTSGVGIEVICVRLTPPSIRLNLFSPACWKEHAENRRSHREQIKRIMDRIQLIPNTVPLIVGGDFNVPANDGALSMLKLRLRDSFREGGIGWGNTALNSVPLFRLDQVWISRQFHGVTVVSRKTNHSDHRIVICDVLLCEPLAFSCLQHKLSGSRMSGKSPSVTAESLEYFSTLKSDTKPF
jgi:hypothetical protein